MKILKLCNLFYGLTKLGEIEWGKPIAPPGETLSKKHNVLLNNSEILNKIVAKHNIRGKYIGAGAFSVVYSDGSIVTKITPYKEDAYKLLALEQLKDKVPEKYKKHILEIFDLDYDSEYKVYILAIERLVPVTSIPEAAAIIHPVSMNEWYLKIKSVLHNIPYLNSLYNIFSSQTDGVIRKVLKGIQVEFINNLSKLEVTDDTNQMNFEMLLIRSLDDLVENPFNNYALMLDEDELKVFKSNYLELFKKLQNFMYFLADNVIDSDASKMPRSYKELNNNEIILLKSKMTPEELKEYEENEIKNMKSKLTPEEFQKYEEEYKRIKRINSTLYSKDVKDLLEFLKYLKTHKIYYFDAHRDNIMLRPGTNDLVISDPGSYIIS